MPTTHQSSVPAAAPAAGSITRDDAIREIRSALRRRSGKTWSVTGGRGTGWGWIRIDAPPARRVDGYLTPQDRAELGELLGLGKPVHHQGVSIPASNAYYREYIDRANGIPPTVHGEPYWD